MKKLVSWFFSKTLSETSLFSFNVCWNGFLLVFFLKLKLLECCVIKYVSTSKLSMTNHNHSNQWEKFVRTFFSLILFSSFFFQMHQGDSGGTLFGKDYAKAKDWWWWWWWWWCSFVADCLSRPDDWDKKTTRAISFCFIKFFLTFWSVYRAWMCNYFSGFRTSISFFNFEINLFLE